MTTQRELRDSPLLKANIFSKLFFWWLNSFFSEGIKRDLEISDLHKTLPSDKSKKLGDGLAKQWEKEVSKPVPSLRRAIVREYGLYYLGLGVLVFTEECVTRIAQPLFLGMFIKYFTNPEEYQDYEGYLFAMAVMLTSMANITTHHPFFFGVEHVGMKIRIACSSLVYRKALRLSQAALRKTDVGQLTNLLSNDVNRFDHCTIFLHYLWVGPLQTAIVTYILWGYFGPSCLAGLAVLILFVPFQGVCSQLFSKLRASTATRTDKRIRIMNEIVSGIRVIKMYTWEKPFAALVHDARKDEVSIIRKASYLRAINCALYYTCSKMIIFITFLTYVLTDNVLTAEKVFVSLALYNNVRLNMTHFFTYGVSHAAETLVSIRRLQDFLLMEEIDYSLNYKILPDSLETITDDKKIINQNNNEIEVVVKNLTAKWASEYAQNTLSNVSIAVNSGELIAVIGHVGSGKSSLLNAILKELPALSGHVSVTGNVAYASQEPWIFTGSVRENILLGKEFNSVWYNSVINACALKRDMELFPHGDHTLVGERGTSLSGGQRARISLARAVYANADMYLLDDPLSAVDAEVGRHLFEKCICGLLQDKTRVLVTHQVYLLKSVPRIMLMKSGAMQFEGTYDQLVHCGVEFGQLFNCKTDENFEASSSLKRSNRKGEHDTLRSMENNLNVSTENETGTHPKVVEEAQISGDIKWSLYWKYFNAGSGYFRFSVLVLTNIITQILFTGADWWLNFWTKTQEESYEVPVEKNNTLYEIYTDKHVQIYTYTGIMVALFVASVSRTLLFFVICMTSSVNLHDWMFKGLIRAPISFFESNPSGRILNRVAKDIGLIDELLPQTFFDTLEISLNVIGILVIIGIINPILLAPSAIIFIILCFLRRHFLKTARSVKRLEGICRSPVFSHLSSSLYGLTSIRAFEAEEEFCRQFDEHQDMHTSSWFLFICTTRWFAIWLDWLSVIYIAIVTFSFMLFLNEGTKVGLAVSAAMMLTTMFQWGVRQSAEVENQMVSVERVLEYTKIAPEPPLESANDKRPPPDWPCRGEIEMNNVQLKYGHDLISLRDISCKIMSKEKIGIVGRTGAGKSSMITALFRITEPTGEIIIDGINILQIGLHDLRSKISIIPQDPVLFTGSLRKNLDPFNNYSDDEIWKMLEDVHLSNQVEQSAVGLLMEVAEGGSNFSVGQRQLVCLGRAILKRNKILVLDEATANVDHETDALIQKTIRTKFQECTVLTVAHRLHTVMDSDKILVLDAGEVKEFDEPYALLKSNKTTLYSLVQTTGPAIADNLYKIAKLAHMQRQHDELESMRF